MFFYTSYTYSRFEDYMGENPALTCISHFTWVCLLVYMQSQQNSHPLNHQVILIPLQLPLIYLNCHTFFLERNRPKTCAYTVLFLIVLTPSFFSQKFVTDGNRFVIYHSYHCHILPNSLHVIPSLTIFNGQLTANWFCLIGVLFLFYHSLNTWKRV